MSLESLLVEAAFGRDSWKVACRVVSDSNVTRSGLLTVDSVVLQAGERVLLTAQTDAWDNGPWLAQDGAWTRPTEFDASADVQFGSVWSILSGTTYAGTTWRLTAPVSGIVTLGSTALTVEQDLSGSTGVEAPTPSTLLKRTSTGVARVVGVSLETDTDADRVVNGRMADGSTPAPLTLSAPIVSQTTGAVAAHGYLEVKTTNGSLLRVKPGDDTDGVDLVVLKNDAATPAALKVNGNPIGGGTPNSATPQTIVDATTGGSAGTGTDYLRADTVFALPFDYSTDGDADTFALRGADGYLKASALVAIGTQSILLGAQGYDPGSGAFAVPTLMSPLTGVDIVAPKTANMWIGAFDGTGLQVVSRDDGDSYIDIFGFESDRSTPAAIYVTAATFTVIGGSAVSLHGTSHVRADASGNFATTETHAASTTVTHHNTITTHTESIAQAGSGAGGKMVKLSGLGASGSVQGDYTAGLPGGNTVLGATNWCALGSLVGNVSNKRSFGVGTVGSLTSMLDIYQYGSGGIALYTGAGATSMIVGRGPTTGATFNASGITLRDTLLTAFVPMTKHVSSSSYEYLWTAGGAATVSTATTTTLITIPVQASQGLRVKVTVSAYNITDGTHTVVETTTPWVGRRPGSSALAETVNFVAAAAVGDADAGFGTVDVAVSSNNVLVTAVTTDTDQRRIVAFAEVLPANNP